MESIIIGILGCGGLAGAMLILQRFLTGKRKTEIAVKHDVIQEQNITKIKVNNKKVIEKLDEIKTLDNESSVVVEKIKKVMEKTVKDIEKVKSSITINEIDNTITSDWDNL